jgi:hypothetical protein
MMSSTMQYGNRWHIDCRLVDVASRAGCALAAGVNLRDQVDGFQVEAQSPATHGLNDALRRAIIAKCLARRVDTRCDCCVGDAASAPDVLDNFVVAHQASPVGCEERNQLEDLRFDDDGYAAGAHDGRIEIDLETVKLQQMVVAVFLHPSGLANCPIFRTLFTRKMLFFINAKTILRWPEGKPQAVLGQCSYVLARHPTTGSTKQSSRW